MAALTTEQFATKFKANKTALVTSNVELQSNTTYEFLENVSIIMPHLYSSIQPEQ